MASSLGACESPLYPPASTPGPCFLSHSNGLLNLRYDLRNVMHGVGRGRRCSQSGCLPASARFTYISRVVCVTPPRSPHPQLQPKAPPVSTFWQRQFDVTIHSVNCSLSGWLIFMQLRPPLVLSSDVSARKVYLLCWQSLLSTG